MTMGERIKYHRDNLGMTQDELGEILGVQKSAIAKYENGKVENIKRSTIQKMAELFDVSPCYLMGFDADIEEERQLAKEVTLIQAVQDQWGKKAVQVLSILKELNEEGKAKAVTALEDISEVPKYRMVEE